MRDTAPAIEAVDLTKRFAGHARDTLHVSFSVGPGECVSLLGPSGCGKTTLLRVLMGIEAPSGGRLQIDPSLRDHMSYVFQEPRLVPWRTSAENVRLPLELSSRLEAAADGRIRSLLETLGLGERLDHFPRALSGGMQMRVALARALITEPRLVLLDEPFAALDERTRFRLQDLLLELRGRLGLQFIFVTHSISEAVYLGDRVLLMNRNGEIDSDRAVAFGDRDQSLKLTGEFNAHVRAFAERFSELERES